jgi:hypothetical protein
VSDISLMTDFVKENYWVICESVCNSRINLVVFSINCHSVSIKCPHLQFYGPRSAKDWESLVSGEEVELQETSCNQYKVSQTLQCMTVIRITGGYWYIQFPWTWTSYVDDMQNTRSPGARREQSQVNISTCQVLFLQLHGSIPQHGAATCMTRVTEGGDA